MKHIVDLVLITAGTGKGDEKHPPLGLLYVGSALKNAGFGVRIHHILPDAMEITARHIVADNPLFVGFSVLTGLTTYYSAQMAKMIKALDSSIPVVWGGHHPTFMVNQCLSEDFVDIVCIGEGERTAVLLAQALSNRAGLGIIGSIGYKYDGEVMINKAGQRIANLDSLTLDWSLLDLDRYAISRGDKKTTSFYGSRGCPFSCGFCSSVSFHGRKWRGHSADYVLDNLKYLKDKHGFNSVLFCDDNFMVDKHRAFGIIDGMAKLCISCDTMDIRVDMLDEEMLAMLDSYGASGVFFGWESGNDRLLSLMDKRITVNDIFDKARLLARHPHISVWASGIVGLPTEAKGEINNTINTALKLHHILPNGVVALFQYMPLPGTKLLGDAVKDGFRLPEKAEDWKVVDPQSDAYKVTWLEWFTSADADRIKKIQTLSRNYMVKAGKNTHVIIRVINSVFLMLFGWRMATGNFRLPADLWLYRHLRQWYGKTHFMP